MSDLLLNRLWPHIRPHRARFLAAMGLSLCLAAMGGLRIGLIRPFVDEGLAPEAAWSEVLWPAGLLALLGVLHFPCRFFHFYWIRQVTERAVQSLRGRIFAKFLRLPTSFFDRSKRGTLIANSTSDCEMFFSGLKACADLVREPISVAVYMGMALWTDWQLTAVLLVTTPLVLLIFGASGRRIRRNQAVVQREQGELVHAVAETLGAHKLVKAFNLQGFVTERFRSVQERLFASQVRTASVEEMAHPGVELLGFFAFSGVMVLAYHRIQAGALSVGEFITFIAAWGFLMEPVRKFSKANIHLGQSMAAADRLDELFRLEEEEDQGTVELSGIGSGIEIRGLVFSHGGERVLDGLDLRVRGGERVALVGPSGSGKSTLVHLLMGLYPAPEGSILVDGTPLERVSRASLRGIFGLVDQDLFLFHDTVRANLSLGREASGAEVRGALEAAHAWDFVERLPQGVDTVIGERGVRLSGGQRQRLAIARACLRDAPVLLFDEATSALDNESERIVQQALAELSDGKTLIAVAHRLSTIRDFDRICVVRGGRVAEEGRHGELMERRGEYFKLHQLALEA